MLHNSQIPKFILRQTLSIELVSSKSLIILIPNFNYIKEMYVTDFLFILIFHKCIFKFKRKALKTSILQIEQVPT